MTRQQQGGGFALCLTSASFLEQGGTQLLKLQLLNCLQIVYDCNSWFPEEGILDEAAWDRIQKDIEKAYSQGERSLFNFGSLVH